MCEIRFAIFINLFFLRISFLVFFFLWLFIYMRLHPLRDPSQRRMCLCARLPMPTFQTNNLRSNALLRAVDTCVCVHVVTGKMRGKRNENHSHSLVIMDVTDNVGYVGATHGR